MLPRFRQYENQLLTEILGQFWNLDGINLDKPVDCAVVPPSSSSVFYVKRILEISGR